MMNSKLQNIIKKTKILFLLDIIALAIFTIIYANNVNSMMISSERVSSLIGVFGYLIIPYLYIGIGMKIVNTTIFWINANRNKIINIFTIILESLNFIYINIFFNVIIFFDLYTINEILTYLTIVLFEILNISLLILVIRSVINKEERKI